MSIEKITDKILEDAATQAASIIDQAKAKEKDILADADKLSKQQEDKILEDARKKAQDIAKRVLADARLGAKKEVLSMKQSLIDEAFDATIKAVEDLPNKDYQKLIKCIINSLIKKGRQEIIVAQGDKDKINSTFIDEVNKDIKSKGSDVTLILSKEFDKTFKSGFILRTDTFQIKNSIEQLVLACKGDLQSKIAEVLFR